MHRDQTRLELTPKELRNKRLTPGTETTSLADSRGRRAKMLASVLRDASSVSRQRQYAGIGGTNDYTHARGVAAVDKGGNLRVDSLTDSFVQQH